MTGSADISDGGLYRYRLTRTWDPSADDALLWIMLNPSTADATIDDQTVRKCCGFARRFGYGGIDVVNLFALRSSNPRDLVDSYQAGIDPVGPWNDKTIRELLSVRRTAVAAWGAFAWPAVAARVEHISSMLRNSLCCLGWSKSGAPRHPLYVPYTAELQPWPAVSPSHSAASRSSSLCGGRRGDGDE